MVWKGGVLFVSAIWLVLIPVCLGENVVTTKVFIIPIAADKFNWSKVNPEDEFEYTASLVNAPDLPKWIEYTYSQRHRTGFLYGVPPKDQDSLQIEVVGLNKNSYETKRRVLHLNILEKMYPASREIHLKIDNVNVEDFFDNYRMNRLLDIFRFKLWKESFPDLYCTFFSSAVAMGARLPLKPSEGEGVVIRLGSTAPYSTTLVELQEEVKPLAKLQHCPRDFKRTTVERYFRDEGFILDWCNFKLVDGSTPLNKPETFVKASEKIQLQKEPVWYQPKKEEVLNRNRGGRYASTMFFPVVVLIILVVLLTFIVGIEYRGTSRRKSQIEELTPPLISAGINLHGIRAGSNGFGRSRTSSPHTCVHNIGADGISRPTPPPYSAAMKSPDCVAGRPLFEPYHISQEAGPPLTFDKLSNRKRGIVRYLSTEATAICYM